MGWTNAIRGCWLIAVAGSGPWGCTCQDIVESTAQQAASVRAATAKIPPLPNGCLPPKKDAAPAVLPVPGGGRVRITAYGRDTTDGSGVSWNQPYPSPCLDDKPPRKGYPNAAWHGNAAFEGDNLCLEIDGLYTQYPPQHQLQIGYSLQLLGGATLEDGQTRKDLVLLDFVGEPKETTIRKCVPIKSSARAPSGSAAPGASAAPGVAASGGAAGAPAPAATSGRPAGGPAGAGTGTPTP